MTDCDTVTIATNKLVNYSMSPIELAGSVIQNPHSHIDSPTRFIYRASTRKSRDPCSPIRSRVSDNSLHRFLKLQESEASRSSPCNFSASLHDSVSVETQIPQIFDHSENSSNSETCKGFFKSFFDRHDNGSRLVPNERRVTNLGQCNVSSPSTACTSQPLSVKSNLSVNMVRPLGSKSNSTDASIEISDPFSRTSISHKSTNLGCENTVSTAVNNSLSFQCSKHSKLSQDVSSTTHVLDVVENVPQTNLSRALVSQKTVSLDGIVDYNSSDIANISPIPKSHEDSDNRNFVSDGWNLSRHSIDHSALKIESTRLEKADISHNSKTTPEKACTQGDLVEVRNSSRLREDHNRDALFAHQSQPVLGLGISTTVPELKRQDNAGSSDRSRNLLDPAAPSLTGCTLVSDQVGESGSSGHLDAIGDTVISGCPLMISHTTAGEKSTSERSFKAKSVTFGSHEIIPLFNVDGVKLKRSKLNNGEAKVIIYQSAAESANTSRALSTMTSPPSCKMDLIEDLLSATPQTKTASKEAHNNCFSKVKVEPRALADN